MAEAQGLIARPVRRALRDGQGPVLQDAARRAPRRRTSRSARRRSAGTRTRSQGTLEGDELRLYRLIWQRAVASQMASKEVETTTVDLVAGDYRLRASATRTLFDGFARVYTEGQDDAAEEAERSLPPLQGGRRHDHRRGHPQPALHRAAAALHRGVADQGARGARDRPAVDVRRDDLDDRRARLRPRRAAPPAPRDGRVLRDRLPRATTSATTSTSGSPPAWRRTSTRSRAASASGCRCCASSTRRSSPLVDEHKGDDPRHRADGRGLLARAPDGDPSRAQRRVHGLLHVPGAQGDATAARVTRRPSSRARATCARSAARGS